MSEQFKNGCTKAMVEIQNKMEEAGVKVSNASLIGKEVNIVKGKDKGKSGKITFDKSGSISVRTDGGVIHDLTMSDIDWK